MGFTAADSQRRREHAARAAGGKLKERSRRGWKPNRLLRIRVAAVVDRDFFARRDVTQREDGDRHALGIADIDGIRVVGVVGERKRAEQERLFDLLSHELWPLPPCCAHRPVHAEPGRDVGVWIHIEHRGEPLASRRISTLR